MHHYLSCPIVNYTFNQYENGSKQFFQNKPTISLQNPAVFLPRTALPDITKSNNTEVTDLLSSPLSSLMVEKSESKFSAHLQHLTKEELHQVLFNFSNNLVNRCSPPYCNSISTEMLSRPEEENLSAKVLKVITSDNNVITTDNSLNTNSNSCKSSSSISSISSKCPTKTASLFRPFEDRADKSLTQQSPQHGEKAPFISPNKYSPSDTPVTPMTSLSKSKPSFDGSESDHQSAYSPNTSRLFQDFGNWLSDCNTFSNVTSSNSKLAINSIKALRTDVTPLTSTTSSIPRYQCDGCGKSYSTFNGLSKHKEFHCISHVRKQFGCRFCDKTYTTLGALKMHIRTHTLPCRCQV